MRINFWTFTLHHKAYWLWCVVVAAHYADWSREQKSKSETRSCAKTRMTKLE